jgi:hypothetical protein
VKSILVDPQRLSRGLFRRGLVLFRKASSGILTGGQAFQAVRSQVQTFVSGDRESELSQFPKSYFWTWVRLLRGAWIYVRTGETPYPAHIALLALFIKTGGRANDFMSRVVGLLHPPYRLPEPTGVLGKLTQKDLAAIQSQLETDGYYVFENCLSSEFCERIVEKSLNVDCLLTSDELLTGSEPVYSRYTRGETKAAWYTLSRDDTTDIEEVQQLVSDPSLIAVAQNYLKSKPIFTAVAMSWSAPVKGAPDISAAQEFHWDMERIKWLRYFVYLTDVTAERGPHCFIKGSHRAGAIPDHLLQQGYNRIKDDVIFDIYGNDAYREFTGLRGTIVAEDSRGFHKGKFPTGGDRLLLAFEISNTAFGANKRHTIRNVRVPQFASYAKKYPRIYSNFDFSPPPV